MTHRGRDLVESHGGNVPSLHISPGFVARAWRSMRIKAARTEAPGGILEQYVEDRRGSTALSRLLIRARSRNLVRYAG